MNRILKAYLAELRPQLGTLPPDDRRKTLDEIREHLEQDMADRRKADKALSEDEAALQATHDFGDPKDIGVAYGNKGGVVRRSTGEVLLHVAVLTGRGVARTVSGTLKVVGIIVLVLIGVGLVVAAIAAFVLVEYKDEIAASVPRPIYSYDESWAAPDVQTGTRSGTFQVSTDATGFDIGIEASPSTGCVTITLIAPDNTVAYNSGQACDDLQEHLHFSQQGSWRIQYAFGAYTGSISVGAYEYRDTAA
jgi:hypothetical protein